MRINQKQYRAVVLGLTICCVCEAYALMYAFAVLPIRPLLPPLFGVLLSVSGGLLIEYARDPDWNKRVGTEEWSEFHSPLGRAVVYALAVFLAVLGRLSLWFLVLSLVVFLVLVVRLIRLFYPIKLP